MKILITGEALFRSQGYHATGINEILKASGVSKGSFYNYFSSKEDFALQVVDLYGTETGNIIRDSLNIPQTSHVDRIRSFAQKMIAVNASENGEKGCLVYNFSFEMAAQNQAIAQRLDHHLETWIDLIEPVVRAGQEVGEITDRFPAREMAMMIHTAINGAAGRMKIHNSIQPIQQMLDMILALIKA